MIKAIYYRNEKLPDYIIKNAFQGFGNNMKRAGFHSGLSMFTAKTDGFIFRASRTAVFFNIFNNNIHSGEKRFM